MHGGKMRTSAEELSMRNLLVPASVLSTLTLCVGSLIASTTIGPSLRDLEKLSYSYAAGSNAQSTIQLHDQLRSGARLLYAYGTGIEAVHNYREPVLTRGATGIALFRSASP